MLSVKKGVNILILVLTGLMIFFFVSQTSAFELKDLIGCGDQDGRGNFEVASWVEYAIEDYAYNPIIKYDKCVGNIAWDYICPEGGGYVSGDPPADISTDETYSSEDIELLSTITGGTIDSTDFVGKGLYLEQDCDLLCFNGRCAENLPAIDLSASYSPTVSGIEFSDVVYINCQAASVNNIPNIVLTIKGYDVFNQLWVNYQGTYACGSKRCNVQEFYDADSTGDFEDFEKTIPGRYEVTCSSTDDQGNTNSKTKNFQTSCDTVCEDTAPPYIQEFSLTEFSIDFVWIEVNALDAVSGTDFMTLLVENSPLGNDEWEIISDEIFQCTQLECLRYEIHKGPGDWRATIQVFDKEGNMATQSSQDTKGLFTGVTEPPEEDILPEEEPIIVEEPEEETPVVEEPVVEEEPELVIESDGELKEFDSAIRKIDEKIALSPPGEDIWSRILNFMKKIFG